jgi:thiosulfate dehydrogenase
MNCQNCHLEAGAKPWGNNLAAVYATYPQFRARSNNVQDIYGRVNDCFKRSLNGQAIDTNSLEMLSIYSYIKWLGARVKKGQKPANAGLPKLPILDRAASPQKGKFVYTSYCQACHGKQGEGLLSNNGTYVYPPLWGKNSYNNGAGLYRVSSLASFVSNNMPLGSATHSDPALTNEQVWDVSAFVNSQSRPEISQVHDYPDRAKKPFDFPYGPYSDSFSEAQHKFGPYAPIQKSKGKNG